MEAESNFWIIWTIYFAASVVFYAVFWVATAFRRALWISYSLRGLMAALILTPWYASSQGATMAPALIVVLLDLITIGGSAASRAAVPLVLSLIAAEFVATLLYLIVGRRKKASKNN